MGNVSKKVEGIDIVRLRCYVQFENRTGDIDIQDAIVDTDAFISLIPFFITAVSGTPPAAHDLRINATDNSPDRNSNTTVSISLTFLPQEAISTYNFSTGAGE